ncbi:hypothetical protein [Salmonella phage vB_SenS_SB10]|uniref:Uncharacterized protein n=1 Tax=Salmonella phage vB_SenS_SB10 TaxID=2591134 RepID=A0A5J6T948_9CAUD|nr:hypothetical protein [Salmonella phage vB_SenS_SB10]
MSVTKTVRVSMKDGSEFEAELTSICGGWEAYLPHLSSIGRGITQMDAIIDALNEASSGL